MTNKNLDLKQIVCICMHCLYMCVCFCRVYMGPLLGVCIALHKLSVVLYCPVLLATVGCVQQRKTK